MFGFLTALREIRVSGTALMTQLMRNSPNNVFRVSGNHAS